METLFVLWFELEQRAESGKVKKEFSVVVKSQRDLNSNPGVKY